MTKRQKELEAWWEKIESIDDAGLMIGFRVGLSGRKKEPAQPAKVKVGGRRDTKSAATVELGSARRFSAK